MRKRITALITAVCLLIATAGACLAEGGEIRWAEEERARLRAGNPTPMQGKFFTGMWGGTTSDIDVRDLLHGYSPVCYDIGLTKYRFDHSVIQDAAIMDDEEGNRTYMLVFYDDLKWSSGEPITAWDYAFSILFCMDPAIAETGGTPMDASWICGAEEYLSRKSATLSGVRVITDQILQIQAKAEALPYFYELSRLAIRPYPAAAIAPGIMVKDDGEGIRLSDRITAEMIRDTVLDAETGYLSHPTIVSGPYKLTEYSAGTAKLTINPYYKGTEEGILPRIGELEYTLAKNEDMIGKLMEGEFGLLNKVTLSRSIQDGIRGRSETEYAITADNYARVGLTMIRFTEGSPLVQEPEVRKAIALCFDRKEFTENYTGPYGLVVDGMYGLGQWMYQLGAGLINAPVDESLPEKEAAEKAKAYGALTLDGLTKYSLDTTAAAAMLDQAGWKKNEAGIRSKETGGTRRELRLTIGIPENEEARKGLETSFICHLEEAGIAAEIKTMTMAEIGAAYRGETETTDMIYLGEDFSILIDPAILKPTTAEAEKAEKGSLPAVKNELYGMAREMVKTEPDDIPGFMRKWIALQERITETLPLIPVYSNVYFDFFSREVHNYRIPEAVTWGAAIVESYISDTEEIREEDKLSLQRRLEQLEKKFLNKYGPQRMKD